MKTSELTGAALDWAVAKCEGAELYISYGAACRVGGWIDYSTDWAQGGPIIEREEIGVQCIPAGTRKGWWALVTSRFHDRSSPDEVRGDTPLIAAMRCYVASKLGDDVDVPPELV
jgi:hypothetical protein